MRKILLVVVFLFLLTIIHGQALVDSLPRAYLKSNIGFLVGTVESEMKAPFSFMSDYNFRATKMLHLGMGAGIEFYQTTYIPFFLTASVKPFSRNVIFSCAGGYTLPLNNRVTFNDGYDYKFSAGYFFNPEISYVFHKTGNRQSFVVGIGYRYQRTDAKRLERDDSVYRLYYPYYDYTLITVFNRFSFRLGYLFF